MHKANLINENPPSSQNTFMCLASIKISKYIGIYTHRESESNNNTNNRQINTKNTTVLDNICICNQNKNGMKSILFFFEQSQMILIRYFLPIKQNKCKCA